MLCWRPCQRATFFRALYRLKMYTGGKPDPEVYLLAASRVGVAAERCIVVEDASAGIEGGRRVGMRTLG